jgi:uncharacterized protein (TIGR03086 family)
MPEIAERYRKVAAAFTERAKAVPDDDWDNPAPCEGWVARDVVRHMVGWMPAFLTEAEVAIPRGPSPDTDPVGAWLNLNDALQAALDDPDVAGREYQTRMGPMSVEDAIAEFCLGDVLVHTWDLARATGLDETLDADEVHRLFLAMQPAEDAMRKSGHYGTKVDVPEGADEQTRLIAFTGRQP